MHYALTGRKRRVYVQRMENSIMTRCVVLLSGGLDSMLAIRIMQEQGIEVEALNFKTMFTCCQDTSAQAARALNVPITVVGQEEDYLDLIREPQLDMVKALILVWTVAYTCFNERINLWKRLMLNLLLAAKW